MLIAVDNGNACTKTSNFIFTSGLEISKSKPILDTETIKYKDNYYVLSKKRLIYENDKTKDEKLLILTLFAITKELKLKNSLNDVVHIDLSVGLPLGHFHLLKDKFKNYFLENNTINYFYNNKEIVLHIENVFVFPQSFSAIATKASEVKKYSKSFVIDIGGYTVDTMLLVNGNPELSKAESLELGIITYFNKVKKDIYILYGMKIDDSDIEEILRGNKENFLIENKNIVNIINENAKNHVNEIISQLRENGVDLMTSYPIFVGGGSILFKKYIEQSDKLNKFGFIEDPKANALGYYLLASKILRGK